MISRNPITPSPRVQESRLASAQLSPTPMSTTSGGSSSKAPHISVLTSSRTALTSDPGTSSSSSSCTWSTRRVARPSSRSRSVNADHRHLDDVRVRPLHDEVDGEALAERAGLAVSGSDLRNGPAPPEQRRHVAVPRRLLDRPRDERPGLRETREIRVDVLLGLVARDLEVLRKTERRDPVDDPEVDHLRDRPFSRRQLRRVLAEHLGGGCTVDVLAARKRLFQLRLARHVREDPQLDLRVVGRQELRALLGR